MPDAPRILLDECVPARLYRLFPRGWTVQSVEYAGFKGLRNGRLVAAITCRFDVLVTVDAGIAGEQNWPALPLALITIVASSNAPEILAPYIPRVAEIAPNVAPGSRTLVTLLDLD